MNRLQTKLMTKNPIIVTLPIWYCNFYCGYPSILGGYMQFLVVQSENSNTSGFTRER
jgi:hypothetical protein